MNTKKITAIVAIVVGLLFLILKGEVISIALTVLAVGAVAMGIYKLIKKETQVGITAIVIGVVVGLCGWLFVNVTLVVIAVLMILGCVMNLLGNLKNDGYKMSVGQALKVYLKPVLGIIAGICLLFNQGGVMNWVFIVTGVLFIIEGAMLLIEK